LAEKLVLIFTSVFSFLVFKNVVMRSRWGKRNFDTARKVFISEGIILIALLITSFLLESVVRIPGAVSEIIDGVFIGMATSVAGRLGEPRL
jgi:hypothetical protein